MTDFADREAPGGDSASESGDTALEAVAASVVAATAVAWEFALDRPRRARALRALADTLDAHSKELVELADRETSLGVPRLTGEVARTSGQLRMFAGVVDDGDYREVLIDDRSTGSPVSLHRSLVPLGPVAVFAAGNFPFAFSVLGGDTASALAAGCPVVVKAHPGHPITSTRVADLARSALATAGVPDGVLSIVSGMQPGVALIGDPGIRAAAFTGSQAGGRALLRLIGERAEPIPFYGELGSLNPIVITPGAAASRSAAIAEGLAGSILLGGGQFCTKPGVVLVPGGVVGDRLVGALAERIERAGSFVPLDPRIGEGYLFGLERQSAFGRTLAASDDGGRGIPASLMEVAGEDAGRLEEVFGPAAAVVRYGDEDDLLRVLSALESSLVVTIHSEPAEGALRRSLVAASIPHTGRIVFDDYPTGVAVVPAQHHGGPWPASTSIHTSVGSTAIRRFLRPIALQGAPDDALPELLGS